MSGRPAQLLGALLCGAALAACGQGDPAGAGWRATHPDPGGYAFLEQGQLGGVCAISVHYPEDAPSAIVHGGTLYLQRRRAARRATGAPDVVVARSADWMLVPAAGGGLALLTPSDRFEYDLKSTC
ncbi:MAG: hypothetical protein ABR541_06045 [Candidatus Dormibacteria bacterium]